MLPRPEGVQRHAVGMHMAEARRVRRRRMHKPGPKSRPNCQLRINQINLILWRFPA